MVSKENDIIKTHELGAVYNDNLTHLHNKNKTTHLLVYKYWISCISCKLGFFPYVIQQLAHGNISSEISYLAAKPSNMEVKGRSKALAMLNAVSYCPAWTSKTSVSSGDNDGPVEKKLCHPSRSRGHSKEKSSGNLTKLFKVNYDFMLVV